jgi:hypothetical protein
MPSSPELPRSVKSYGRPSRATRSIQPKVPCKDLLIIECNSTALAADRLDLGTAFAKLLSHDLVKPFLPNKAVALVQTSTADKLPGQFRGAFEEHGRFRTILIVGHSNPAGLQLASDQFSDWRVVGQWLKPFDPKFIFLVACEAGKSETVRQLFGPLRKTLREVYASPVKLYGTQAAALSVIIGELLLTGKIDDERSLTARLLNYISTGGQIYRWSYDEAGPGADIPVASWDRLATALDFGHWDLNKSIEGFIQRIGEKP